MREGFFFFNERACAGFNADEKEPVKREVVDGGGGGVQKPGKETGLGKSPPPLLKLAGRRERWRRQQARRQVAGSRSSSPHTGPASFKEQVNLSAQREVGKAVREVRDLQEVGQV